MKVYVDYQICEKSPFSLLTIEAEIMKLAIHENFGIYVISDKDFYYLSIKYPNILVAI